MSISTEAGSCGLEPLEQRVHARRRPATVLVPGWRWIASTIARWPLNQLATRLFCTSSITSPRSRSRTGAPLRHDHDQVAELLRVLRAGRRPATVAARFGPHRMPVGRLTLRVADRVATPRRCRCRATASACGSSWMRTAYFCEPNTCTCATPVDHRDALRQDVLGVLVELRQRQQSARSAPGTGSASRPGSPSGRRAG